MSKVLTFSRAFPSYHPKAGQPTYFVEKFWNSIDTFLPFKEIQKLPCSDYGILNDSIPLNLDLNWKKHHTIRAGHRWKVGDKFSPRVWSGKPYNSKMIVIAPDIEIKKIWDFKIEKSRNLMRNIFVNEKELDILFDEDFLSIIAKNDGLKMDDLFEWFQYPKPFDGQIICWNDSIEY